MWMLTKHSHSSPSTLKVDLQTNRSCPCSRPSASFTSIWTNQTRPSTIKHKWRGNRRRSWTVYRPQASWGVRFRPDCKIRSRCQSPLTRTRSRLQPRWVRNMTSHRFCQMRGFYIHSWQLTVNSLSKLCPSNQWRRWSQTRKGKSRNWQEIGTSEFWALETRFSYPGTWSFRRYQIVSKTYIDRFHIKTGRSPKKAPVSTI